MNINIDTDKKVIEIVGDTNVKEVLAFIEHNKYEDYKIASRVELVNDYWGGHTYYPTWNPQRLIQCNYSDLPLKVTTSGNT
jgi:hypothetical protein